MGMGMLNDPVPVAGLAENFSPMARMAPPPLGSDGSGADTTWKVDDERVAWPVATPGTADGAWDSAPGALLPAAEWPWGASPASRGAAGSRGTPGDGEDGFARRSSTADLSIEAAPRGPRAWRNRAPFFRPRYG